MKKQVTLFLLLLSYLQVVAAPPSDYIQFIDGQLPEVQQLAATKGKLYFVHFTAQWCMPCQWMEKNTFNNRALAQFANENYLAVRIDIDQPEGESYKKEYLITNLPSLLIFNAKGQLKARWETSLDAKQLLQILQKHNTPENRHSNQLISTKPIILDSPSPVFATTLSAPQPHFAQQSTNFDRITAYSPANQHAPAPPKPVIPLQTTFAIQTGVFSSYTNAVGEVMRLETMIKQPINLITGSYNGRQIYKVVVGRFSSRINASAYLSELRKHSINGIIKSLD